MSHYSGDEIEAPPPKLQVLVVDDSRICRKLTKECIRKELKAIDKEALFHDCEDGLQAVNMVKNSEYRFDIICMDSVMESIDGLEATRCIRALGFRGVIVAISGNVQPEDVNAFMTAGADHFISKPFDLQQFSEVLKKIAD